MVGEDQVASTSFADLVGDFGVQSLIGKSICVIPDARTPRHGDNMRGLELLLNIAAATASRSTASSKTRSSGTS
jgi:hypothetical protein